MGGWVGVSVSVSVSVSVGVGVCVCVRVCEVSKGMWHSRPATCNEAVDMRGKREPITFMYLQKSCSWVTV